MSLRPRALRSIDLTLLSLALLASMAAIVVYPGSFGADAHAVYLPIVRGLLDGRGLTAFAPLVHGALRLPAYPALLAGASGLTGDLRAGVQLTNAGAMTIVVIATFVGVTRAGARAPWPGIAAVLVALEPNSIEAAGRGLPDALAAGLVATFFLLILEEERKPAPRAAVFLVAAGLLVGLALQVRLNLIGLWAAGVATLVVLHRTRSAGRTAAFTVSCAFPMLAVIPVSIALSGVEIEYPVLRLDQGIAAGRRDLAHTSGLARFIAASLLGIGELPTRLWRTVGAPWVLIGVPALLIGLLRRPRDPARLLAAFTFVALLLVLAPIHFEARYYTFAAPLLVGASIVALDGLIRGPWTIWLAPLTGLLILAFVARETPLVLRRLENRRATEQLVERACTHLERERGDDPALFVFWNSPKVMYSRFADCETEVGAPTRIFIVGASQGGSTAAFRLTEKDSEERYSVDRPERRVEFGPFVFDHLPRELDAATQREFARPLGPEVASRRWSKELPRHRALACERELLPLPTGRYRLRLHMPSRGRAAGRLILGIGKREWSFFGANGSTHDRIVEHDRPEPLWLRFCPISPYASGRIEMELSLHAILAEPAAPPAAAP